MGILEIIAIARLVITGISAVWNAGSAAVQIDDTIRELEDEQKDINARLGEVEGEKTRKLAQADATLALQTTQAATETTAVTTEEARKEAQLAAQYTIAEASFVKQLADLEASKALVENRRVQLIAEAQAKHAGDETEIAARLANIDATLDLEMTDIDRKIADFLTNKDANIAEAIRRQDELLASKDETLSQLQLKATLGDEESARKVAQVEKYRDENLKATRDDTVMVLNEAGEQNRFDIGQTTVQAQLQKSSAEAQASAGGVRRAGTPLMAMRQSIMAAQEEADRTAAAANFAMTLGGSRLTAKLTQYRSQASGNIEDIWSANTLYDQDLAMQTQNAELQFTQGYANLEATKADLERQYTQDYAAYEAERNTKNVLAEQERQLLGKESVRLDTEYTTTESGFEYDRINNELTHTQTQVQVETQQTVMELQNTQDIANLQQAAAESKKAIADALAGQVLTAAQNKEDITAGADLLTAQYSRLRTDIETEQTSLGAAKWGKVFGAALTGTEGIVASAESLLDKNPALLASLNTWITGGRGSSKPLVES